MSTEYLGWFEMRHILQQHQMPIDKCLICKEYDKKVDVTPDEICFAQMDEDIKRFRRIFCNSNCAGVTVCEGNFAFGSKRDLDKSFALCKKYRYFVALK